jgi:hypothetical protein
MVVSVVGSIVSKGCWVKYEKLLVFYFRLRKSETDFYKKANSTVV